MAYFGGWASESDGVDGGGGALAEPVQGAVHQLLELVDVRHGAERMAHVGEDEFGVAMRVSAQVAVVGVAAPLVDGAMTKPR